MDLVAKTRELGALLQQDERYIKLMAAQKANEEDAALNELISKIQLLQMSFQHEASKEDRDEAKLQEYDTEFGQVYAQIMANENMRAYEEARAEIDKLMTYLTGILGMCLQGADPATCEPAQEHECGGECSSCGGCH
ncbi:MAG: YlbF family regulator [Clostridia bacterium]|nr:YlbF family regulator [Clostridia bacterium]